MARTSDQSAEAVFVSAIEFNLASTTLGNLTDRLVRLCPNPNGTDDITPGLMTAASPYAVCRSFAIELFVKSLLKSLDIAFPRVHLLSLLFSKLPESIRDAIRVAYAYRFSQSILNYEVGAKNNNKSVLEYTEFDYVLSSVESAFTVWRYVCDAPVGVHQIHPCLLYVEQALVDVIIQNRPDWGRHLANVPLVPDFAALGYPHAQIVEPKD